MTGSAVTLHAPLRGWCAPLDETPDEVFAQRLLGDGVAIDPTGDTLHAPCDGEVISVAVSKHAVAVRAENGAEILMHVGIDTVALAGKGFEALVQQGARVKRGQPLLKFDLDVLAQSAKSLITPILITNGDRFAVANVDAGRSVDVGDAIFEIRAVSESTLAQTLAGSKEVSVRFEMPLEHGIHARPAAVIANFAKTQSFEITVSANGRSANARSAVSLMALGAKHGDEVAITAAGENAERVLEQLKQAILSIREAPQAHAASAAKALPAGAPEQEQTSRAAPSNRLRGVIASRGLAVGRAVTLKAAEIAVIEAGRGIAHESAEFERARDEVRARLNQLVQHSKGPAKDVISAHLEFIDDWELVASARRAISRGKSAAFAWRRAVRDSADTLRALGDQRMSERVDDLIDLESQVLLALSGAAPAAIPELPERAILVAEDLKPSQLVSLDANNLAGICLAAGGPTSHVAILAAAMGVPALVALGSSVLTVEDGAWLVLDAEQGNLSISPDQVALAAAEQTLSQRRQRQQSERAAASTTCRRSTWTGTVR
jgi:phosphocarrier protein FPr/phosphocarrier protein